jgi:hypothetical protein
MGVADTTQGNSTYITGGNTVMTTNQLVEHSHSISFNNSNYTYETNQTANTETVSGGANRLVSANTNSFPTATENNSSNQSDFRPPYCVVQYIIKY